MSENQVIELDDGNFDDEVFGIGQPVLVEFYSQGSYSSRELSGIVDDLAGEYEGKVRIGRLDVDANWQTAKNVEVSSVPTVLLFQNDRVVERIDSPKTREEYQQCRRRRSCRGCQHNRDCRTGEICKHPGPPNNEKRDRPKRCEPDPHVFIFRIEG